MSDLPHKSSNPSPNARFIEHEINNKLHHPHQDTNSLIYDEVHKLRHMDSSHGKPNTHQYANDLKEIDRFLHQKHLLPHTHIITHGKHIGEIAPDKKHSESNHQDNKHGGSKPTDDKHLDSKHDAPPADKQKHAADARPHRDAKPGETPKAIDGPKPPQSQPKPDKDIPIQQQAPKDKIVQAVRPTDATQPLPAQGAEPLSTLNRAIERARAGGKPLSIAQIGDSHVAAGIQTPALAKQLAADNGLSPSQVQFTSHGKKNETASYANSHAKEFLQNINKDTDLVVVSFGSNEAGNKPDQAYKKDYEGLIAKIREKAPGAAVLMVGPTDGNFWATDKHLPYLNEVRKTQQDIANKTPDSAFLDAGAMMGTLASMRQRGMISADNLHLTDGAYDVLGKRIADDITRIIRRRQ